MSPPGELVVKIKLSPRVGSVALIVALRQLKSIHKKGP